MDIFLLFHQEPPFLGGSTPRYSQTWQQNYKCFKKSPSHLQGLRPWLQQSKLTGDVTITVTTHSVIECEQDMSAVCREEDLKAP